MTRCETVLSGQGPSAGGSDADRQRADARVAIAVGRHGSRSVVERVAEAGSARVRFPRMPGGTPEAVLINTGGGVAGGDRFRTAATLGEGAALVVTTVAAEKVYRSHGPAARLETSLTLGPGSHLAWLPQETIVFDRARLHRSLAVSLPSSATALLAEMLVFGRAARGELIRDGFVRDRWDVRRDGRLVYADRLALDGPITERLARPAIGGGARALATVLYVAPDAEARLEEARALMENVASEWGASSWNGLLVLRLLGRTIESLRGDLAAFLVGFRGTPLPRVWQS